MSGEKMLASKVSLMSNIMFALVNTSQGFHKLLAGSAACDCLSLFLIKTPLKVSEKLNDKHINKQTVRALLSNKDTCYDKILQM